MEDNIRMDLGETGVYWIHLVQDRYQWWTLMNMVMNLCIPLKAGSILTS
jgi:hypothetical protein